MFSWSNTRPNWPTLSCEWDLQLREVLCVRLCAMNCGKWEPRYAKPETSRTLQCFSLLLKSEHLHYSLWRFKVKSWKHIIRNCRFDNSISVSHLFPASVVDALKIYLPRVKALGRISKVEQFSHLPEELRDKTGFSTASSGEIPGERARPPAHWGQH